MSNPKPTPKLNPQWVKEIRDTFTGFLHMTRFPHPVRHGRRGGTFTYPEWLIMFIAILAVKCKVKTYLAIHRLALQYWEIIAEDLDLDPPSESQLRERLKKIGHHPALLRESILRRTIPSPHHFSGLDRTAADPILSAD